MKHGYPRGEHEHFCNVCGKNIIHISTDFDCKVPISKCSTRCNEEYLYLHPWLTDIRLMARMLEGDITIPHFPYKNYTKDGKPVSCDVCLEAHIMKNKYILSKERRNCLTI